MTATAGTGSVFAGWHGDLVSTANPETIVISRDMAITATFDVGYDVYLPVVMNNVTVGHLP